MVASVIGEDFPVKKALKWAGIILGGLVGLVLIAAVVLYAIGSSQLNRTYSYQVDGVTIPDDAEAVAQGQHIVETRLCTECHGENLAGTEFINEAPFGYVPAPNLTSGAGGAGATFSDEDWVIALRHGVGPDSRGLVVMPSEIYTYLSDDDLASLIAYLKQIESVDNDLGERALDPPAVLFLAAGMFQTAPDLIDHEAAQANVTAGPTAEYGKYLAESAGCTLCHGANLAGATLPGESPDTPPSPNLTPAGVLGNWSEADFVTAIRTGVTPEGTGINPEEMPWRHYANFTDEELTALWAYLQSVPAVASE